MFGGSAIGFAVIVGLLGLGWMRRTRPGLPGGGGDRAATAIVVVLGVAVPIVVLTILFVYSDIFVLRSVAAPRKASTQLTVKVIGRQWFWEVRYPGTSAATANEIHIPVGARVNVVGTSDDVIHSFWVPQLNRKIDLIPGRTNRVLLQADRTGRFRGNCVEFCGLQHAHMGVLVFAEPPARFQAWLRNEAKPARTPTTALQRSGREIFDSQACSGCHTIRGTSARGTNGPDLTHLETRQTLAALAIPNRRADLERWIRDPQHVKPGSKMPGLELTKPELRDLMAYLESLR
ncbi:MAG: c-type cytochrome [Actinobacteria bacterium]|nr:MAG: c-type cytochrome [Actinomycetota bacterium]